MAGDFSLLEPLFSGGSKIVEWLDEGFFRGEPAALAEALTCACFLGRTEVASRLLAAEADPAAGDATGHDALNWAAAGGRVEAVRLLIACGAPLEARNRFGGTPLGQAVWSALHEPRPGQREVIEILLASGARVSEAGYPTGREDVDAILRKHGAA